MSEKPIKSTLFNFVSIRNPQLLSKEEKERGFIFFPDTSFSESAYLENISTINTRDQRRQYLSQVSNSFSYYTSRKFIRINREELFDFSLWLMKNKNTITKAEAEEKTTSLSTLSLQDEIELWDNLFYQINTKKSDAVREAVIQLIIANNFIKKNDYSSDSAILITSDEQLRRLANAYVVIPDPIPSNYMIKINPLRRASYKDFQVLESQIDAHIARMKKGYISQAIEEINQAIQITEITNQDAYNRALQEYNVKVDEAYNQAKPVEDPETGEVHYEDLNLPEFRFERQHVFNDSFLQKNVSGEAYNLVKNLKLEAVSEDEDVLKMLEEKIKEQENIIDQEDKNLARDISYRGVKFKAKSRNIPKHTSVAKITKSNIDKNKGYFSLNIATGNSNMGVTANEFILNFSDSSSIQMKPNFSQGSDDTLILTSDLIDISNTPIKADVLIDFEDGREIEVSVPEVKVEELQIKDFNVRSDEYNAEQKDIITYGIQKLGVADFRKVEQEVCCYVPGEVSHIENILAREYKERSTRQLLSTENIIEEIEEKEIEKLSDTTTTERNELATEVSSVIDENQSQNQGVSTGVSGSYPGSGISFYADAFMEGASSSATSNSNSTSQTFAQEVVERALERVVTKTTKKRTTRILREFEENNKHGFDNRNGDSHVTGVYRWVDKIYKNKLINYGKRLMYEFSVPEPSKFFKSAILKEVASNSGTSNTRPDGIILPSMPEEPTISSANKITRYNYIDIASTVNAEVEEPPKEYIKIGKSLKIQWSTSGTENRDKKYSSVSDKIEIPEGYVSFSGKSNCQMMFHLTGAESPKIITMIGTDSKEFNISRSGQNIYKNNSRSHYISGDEFEGEIPVGAMIYDNSSEALVQFEVKCKLTGEAYESWKVKTYNAIMEAYEERVQEYNDALYSNFTPEEQTQTERMQFNPLFNRTLEKRELKRLAIQMLTKPFAINLANNHYSNNTSLNLTENLDEHASRIKFFENVFDWDIMAYNFYPYYYAQEDKWAELLKESNGTDSVFQAFMQSGMARMVVPVRPGFEEAVAYYLQTGDVWMGNQLAIDMDDDLYVSIAEELQSTEGEVEETWETRVPTDLTVVQAGTIGLNVEGLPCNPECGGEGTNPIQQSNNLLKGVSDGNKTRYTKNTSNVIDLGYVEGNFCNMANPSTENTYTYVNAVEGGWARVLIDTTGKTAFPSVNNAELLSSDEFEPDSLFDLWLENDGENINYFFTKR